MRLILILAIVVVLLAFPAVTKADIACPQGQHVPAVSWLAPHIDNITMHHFWWRHGEPASGYGPQVILVTDKNFIRSLTALSGSSVPWLGYSSATPFGGFTYPAGGTWFEEYELHVGDKTYQAWIWDEFDYSYKNVLMFTFSNMNVTGTPAGEHDFCAVSIPKASIEVFDPDIYMRWKQ